MKFDLISGVMSADLLNDGVWHHLRSPDGDVLYRPDAKGKPDKSKPLRALVRSTSSGVYRTHMIHQQARAASLGRKARGKDLMEIIEDNAKVAPAENFSKLLVALDNCSSSRPGVIPIEEPDAIEIYNDDASQWMVRQVLGVADDQANYMAQSEEDSPRPPPGEKADEA